MRRLYAFLAALCLFSAALGCHHHVGGVCDCDCCCGGGCCCDYGLCCCNRGGPAVMPLPPDGTVPPGVMLAPSGTPPAPPPGTITAPPEPGTPTKDKLKITAPEK